MIGFYEVMRGCLIFKNLIHGEGDMVARHGWLMELDGKQLMDVHESYVVFERMNYVAVRHGDVDGMKSVVLMVWMMIEKLS